ncbi:helix-turn-helix transcriptional regulator [Arthrobacter sp. UYEF3]|uniref:helix-turn-helix transcriptional regulator n=1 Tax=Arthrobacter sp. UYEF3 TaxID=1756365 RepID=UPI003394F4A9
MEHDEPTPFYRAVDAPSLGRSISEARKEAGLTQQDLAERLKVTRGTVVRLERGDAVSVVVAMQAIRVLGRDVALVPRFSKIQLRP